MEEASEALEFERAAALRDKVRAIERTMESQKMAGFAKRRLDVLGYARSGKEAAVQLFAIRDGKTLNRDIFLL
jgi:excinuclease ABC subunit C